MAAVTNFVEDLLVDGEILMCITSVDLTQFTADPVIYLCQERAISLITDDSRQ